MANKLRLLITKHCLKQCGGCCNKDWDLDNLPVVKHFNYDEILITGGEPLDHDMIDKTTALLSYLKKVDINPKRKVYIYTSTFLHTSVLTLLRKDYCDGLTLTLHDQNDMDMFKYYDRLYAESRGKKKSLRLNIFKGINIPNGLWIPNWTVKKDIVWIPNCPLPKDEVFMRTKTI